MTSPNVALTVYPGVPLPVIVGVVMLVTLSPFSPLSLLTSNPGTKGKISGLTVKRCSFSIELPAISVDIIVNV